MRGAVQRPKLEEIFQGPSRVLLAVDCWRVRGRGRHQAGKGLVREGRSWHARLRNSLEPRNRVGGWGAAG